MKITLHGISGTTYTIEVEKSTTFQYIKEKLFELEGTGHSPYVNILFEGKRFSDSDTMESAGVKEGSVIHGTIILIGS